MRNRLPGVLFLIVGSIVFAMATRNPGFDSIDRKNALVLVGSGIWFGMALIGLFVGINRGRRGSRR